MINHSNITFSSNSFVESRPVSPSSPSEDLRVGNDPFNRDEQKKLETILETTNERVKNLIEKLKAETLELSQSGKSTKKTKENIKNITVLLKQTEAEIKQIPEAYILNFRLTQFLKDFEESLARDLYRLYHRVEHSNIRLLFNRDSIKKAENELRQRQQKQWEKREEERESPIVIDSLGDSKIDYVFSQSKSALTDERQVLSARRYPIHQPPDNCVFATAFVPPFEWANLAFEARQAIDLPANLNTDESDPPYTTHNQNFTEDSDLARAIALSLSSQEDEELAEAIRRSSEDCVIASRSQEQTQASSTQSSKSALNELNTSEAETHLESQNRSNFTTLPTDW